MALSDDEIRQLSIEKARNDYYSGNGKNSPVEDEEPGVFRRVFETVAEIIAIPVSGGFTLLLSDDKKEQKPSLDREVYDETYDLLSKDDKKD